jgi:protein-disulfide isomerase
MTFAARVLALLLLLGGPAAAAEPGPEGFHEFVMGNAKAPVTVIEYVSLTCPHCAHFHTETFPQVKKAYVDTGKVRFLVRDFPLDSLAMAGAVVARCVPADKGYRLFDLLMKNQESWVSDQKPIEPLRRHAKDAGIAESEVDACLQNRALVTALAEQRQKSGETYNIEATPSFFIGDEDIQGDPAFADIAAAIDRQLAKAKKP